MATTVRRMTNAAAKQAGATVRLATQERQISVGGFKTLRQFQAEQAARDAGLFGQPIGTVITGGGRTTFPSPFSGPGASQGMMPLNMGPGTGFGGQPTMNFDPSQMSGLCDLLPDPRLVAACKMGIVLLPGGTTPSDVMGGGGTMTTGTSDGSCPQGSFRVGNTCVSPSDLMPGGDPFTFGTGGTAVQGGFGLPATVPQSVPTLRRKCGRGMVLGIDDLCYPKAVLPGRSKLRKWRRPARPPISRRDVKAIRVAAGAKDRVSELARDVGLKVSRSTRKKKK